MKPVSESTVLIVDHGLFVPLAERLSRDFKRVLYYSGWECAFPHIEQCIIGDGFGVFERVDDVWEVKDEIDLAVFPDIGRSGLQLEFEKQGMPVWGSRRADTLEINRQKFHRLLGQVGLQVPKFEIVTGLSALRQHLQDKEDRYIKISKYRGTIETTHFRSMSLDEGVLDLWAIKFGPVKEFIPFMVFEPIATDLELGGDLYGIDGKWPGLMLQGYEWKDKGYFGSVTKVSEAPKPLREVLDAMSEVLAKTRMRNFFSMEIRVKDDKFWFIDVTPRGGLPSSASQMEMWTNLSPIIQAGAHGELVEPIPADNFTCECVLTMKGDKSTWGVTEVPEDLKRWMKLGSSCHINGRICFPPDPHQEGHEIGWLVAQGSTMESCVKQMLDHVSKLPDGVEANTESLVNLIKEVDKAEEEGMEFTDQPVPRPEIVIKD